MSVKKLAVLAVGLGVAEPVTAVITTVEHVKGSLPGLLVALVVPWVIGAVLLVRGRVTAGAIVVGFLLSLCSTWFPSRVGSGPRHLTGRGSPLPQRQRRRALRCPCRYS